MNKKLQNQMREKMTAFDYAVEELEKIYQESPNLIFTDKLIINKDEFLTALEKLKREKTRIEELRREIIADAKDKAKKIVQDAEYKAFNLIEEKLSQEEGRIQAAFEIKKMGIKHLQNLFSKFKEQVDSFSNDMGSKLSRISREIDSNIKELDDYQSPDLHNRMNK